MMAELESNFRPKVSLPKRLRQGLATLVSASLILLIRGYQVALSPLKVLVGFGHGSCRFTPSCSHYAIQSLKVHGVFRGLTLALRRILKCHPWGSSGWDPVPGTHDGHHPSAQDHAKDNRS